MLRIIGGELRRRPLRYDGDPRTRPMKDRVREAVFNLVGPSIRQKHAIDLFAGTGAMGLEAISRGASRATFVEQHFPTARIIEENIRSLDVRDRAQVIPGSAFLWVRNHGVRPELQAAPWVVFCCPPYAFYTERAAEMDRLLRDVLEHAPDNSTFVVESDDRFSTDQLPDPELWEIRQYPPAVIALRTIRDGESPNRPAQ